MVIVDTSVLIDFFRGTRNAPTSRFRALEIDGTPYAIPAVCCQEVLQGARDEREWRMLRDHLGTQRIVAPRDPLASHLAAARIYYDCRSEGLTIRASADCLIAQLVLEQDGVLLHNDHDFELIRQVRALRTLTAT